MTAASARAQPAVDMLRADIPRRDFRSASTDAYTCHRGNGLDKQAAEEISASQRQKHAIAFAHRAVRAARATGAAYAKRLHDLYASGTTESATQVSLAEAMRQLVQAKLLVGLGWLRFWATRTEAAPLHGAKLRLALQTAELAAESLETTVGSLSDLVELDGGGGPLLEGGGGSARASGSRSLLSKRKLQAQQHLARRSVQARRNHGKTAGAVIGTTPLERELLDVTSSVVDLNLVAKNMVAALVEEGPVRRRRECTRLVLQRRAAQSGAAREVLTQVASLR